MGVLIERSIEGAELSDERLKRLPPHFREIVMHQRCLCDLAEQPVVDLFAMRQGIEHKRYLARHAERLIKQMGE
jgi:hypothetical protein